jgi:hypothetical protein
MSKNALKCLTKLKVPHTRKRDGAQVEYTIRIGLSAEEAQLVSLFLQKQAEGAPSISLIRSLLVGKSMESVGEKEFIETMTKFELKRQLSEKLAKPLADKALYLLNQSTLPAPPPIKPERRVYIPPARTR